MASSRIFLENFSLEDLETVSTLYTEMLKECPDMNRVAYKCKKLESKVEKKEDIFNIEDPYRNFTGIEIVIDRDNAVLAKFMIDEYGLNPIKFLPCNQNVMEVLLTLIDSNIIIDSNGSRPLHLCPTKEFALLLLKYNADPNILNIYGISPLAAALLHPEFSVAKVLFETSTDETKLNALSCLCSFDQNQFEGAVSIRWLLERGVFPPPDTICIAIINRKRIIIEEMLDYNAPLREGLDMYNKRFRQNCMVDWRMNKLADYMEDVLAKKMIDL